MGNDTGCFSGEAATGTNVHCVRSLLSLVSSTLLRSLGCLQRRTKGALRERVPRRRRVTSALYVRKGSSSDEDGVSVEDLEALLQRVNQVEKDRGVGIGGAGSRPNRRASKKQSFKSLLSRVSILESVAVLGVAEGSSVVSSAVQTITSPEEHPAVQSTSGSMAAAVAGPSQPAALDSMSSAVAGSTQTEVSTAASTDVSGREQLVTAVHKPQEVRVERTVDGPSTSAGTARLVHRWRILVCGHNYVHRAERYARNLSFGQLWVALPLHWSSGRVFGAFVGPVLHIGGNDLGLLNGRALYLHARADILKIWRAWPRFHIAWSVIIHAFGGQEAVTSGSSRRPDSV
ncbi:uncharacterized protein [Anolis sagrei]|uniref:uncharacterized protein n=1 Tax=Anolis sagrei TaxID=38937 RepID=UPI00352271DA